MHYSHSSLYVPSKKASRKNRMWSTQAGSSLLLFASRMSPAAENRRSTAVDVAGAVKYLGKGTKWDIGLLALRHKTVSHNTNDFKVFPVVCFGRHGGHKIPQLTLLKLFYVCTICLFTSWKYMISDMSRSTPIWTTHRIDPNNSVPHAMIIAHTMSFMNTFKGYEHSS